MELGASRALPILARRKAIAEKREALGRVVILPPDSASIRIEHQRIAIDAAREVTRLDDQTCDLSKRVELTRPP